MAEAMGSPERVELQQRILGWLASSTHTSSSNAADHAAPLASRPVAEPGAGMQQPQQQLLQPLPDEEAATTTTRSVAPRGRGRVVQLWKKWKSRALNLPAAAAPSGSPATTRQPQGRPLSPAVLKQHQRLCEQEEGGGAPAASLPAALPFDASCVLTAAGGRARGAAGPAAAAAARRLQPVQQQSPVDQAYASSLYMPTTTTTGTTTALVAAPAGGPGALGTDSCTASDQVPPAAAPVGQHGEASGARPQATPGSAAPAAPSPSPALAPAPHCSSCLSLLSPQASSSPAATTCDLGPLRASSSFTGRQQASEASACHAAAARSGAGAGLAEHSARRASSEAHPAGPNTGGNTPDHPVREGPDSRGHADQLAAQPGTAGAPLGSQSRSQQAEPLHKPLMCSPVRHPQLQQLLQEPSPAQRQQVQRMQPAGRASPVRLPAGTALTAYPAVAAALGSAATGGLLQGRWGADATLLQAVMVPHSPAGQTQSTPAAHTCAQALGAATAGSSSCVASAAPEPLVSGDPAAGGGLTAAGSCAGQRHAAAQGRGACLAGAADGCGAAEVQAWLLRAAMLEDELQGRALEVAEQLQQLQEQRRLLGALSSASSSSPEVAAPAAAPGGPSRVKGAHGALYCSGGSNLGLSAAHSIRPQLLQELARLDAVSAQLQDRAVGLGGALATLQGCQVVLASGKAGRLSPGSRLAVLQLVLSDVAARLPGERLHQLPVLQGLPSLDEAGQEICALAGAGSLQACVQPLLQAAPAAGAPHVARAGAQQLARGQQAPAPAAAAGAPESTPAAASAAAVLGMQRSSVPKPAPSVSSAASSYATGPPGRHRRAAAAARGLQRHLQAVQHHSASAAAAVAPWWAGLAPPGDGDSDDDDDDVLDSLSSVLTSRFFTPRPSLAYESRRQMAAAAAASSSAASAGGAPPHEAAAASGASLMQPGGSGLPGQWSGPAEPAALVLATAAAAGAAAVTLTGIASSGSWAAAGPEEAFSSSCVSLQEGLWDMLRTSSPRQQQQQEQRLGRLPHAAHLLPSPLASSSEAASASSGQAAERQGSSRAGRLPPPGLPSLPAWPESPTGVGGALLPTPFMRPQAALHLAPAGTVPSAGPTALRGLAQHHQLGIAAGAAPAADAVMGGREPYAYERRTSAGSAFSCVTAVSRQVGFEDDEDDEPGLAARPQASAGGGAWQAAPGEAGIMAGPLATALPAGVDLATLTVGEPQQLELLQALSAVLARQRV